MRSRAECVLSNSDTLAGPLDNENLFERISVLVEVSGVTRNQNIDLFTKCTLVFKHLAGIPSHFNQNTRPLFYFNSKWFRMFKENPGISFKTQSLSLQSLDLAQETWSCQQCQSSRPPLWLRCIYHISSKVFSIRCLSFYLVTRSHYYQEIAV